MPQPLDYEPQPGRNPTPGRFLFVAGVGLFCVSLGWAIDYPHDLAFPLLMALGGMTAAGAYLSLR